MFSVTHNTFHFIVYYLVSSFDLVSVHIYVLVQLPDETYARGRNWLPDQREVCCLWQKTSLYICYSNCWEGPLYRLRSHVIFIPKACETTAAHKSHFNPSSPEWKSRKILILFFAFKINFLRTSVQFPIIYNFLTIIFKILLLNEQLLCFLCVSFNDALTWYDYMASVTDRHTSIETLWHDKERVRLNKYPKILTQCQLVHHKSHMDWRWFEHVLAGWLAGD